MLGFPGITTLPEAALCPTRKGKLPEMPASRTSTPRRLTLQIRSFRNSLSARMVAYFALAAGVSLWTTGCGSAATQAPTAGDALATTPATAAAMDLSCHAPDCQPHRPPAGAAPVVAADVAVAGGVAEAGSVAVGGGGKSQSRAMAP